MMELIYTSSSKGVDRGSQGYCTVACSDSLPPMLKMNLENMSDYSWIYSPHDKNFNNNPVNYSFVKVKDGEDWLRVIMRIGLNGLDYSGRPNKIAHFICLQDDDLDECHEFSPAQIIAEGNTFVKSWEDGSEFQENDFSELGLEKAESSTTYWEEVTGNGAWANHLVQKYHDSLDSQINILYDEGVDPLRLIAEATTLLSPEEKWETTFSTYFNGTSLNATCNWRFILRGSKYHEGLKSTKNLIDLNKLKGTSPEMDLAIEELSIEGTGASSSEPQSDFVGSGTGRNTYKGPAHSRKKQSNQNQTIVFLLLAIIVLLAIFLGKDQIFGTKEKQDDVVNVEEEEVFYSYDVELKEMPEEHELKEHGDYLVLIKTEEFLQALKVNPKMSLNVFKTKPPKIDIKLESTKQYKVIDNVISKLFLEKVDGEYIQNKLPLIKLRISKELVVESLSDIDDAFIEEFKTNIKKMKVNRVIFEFI